MWKILFGIFLILHGMVHLLYAGQSWRLFELQPGMTWPDGAWLFSKLLGDETTRLVGTIALALVTLGLAASGLGLFFRANWWQTVAIASAVFSSLVFLVMEWKISRSLRSGRRRNPDQPRNYSSVFQYLSKQSAGSLFAKGSLNVHPVGKNHRNQNP